VYPALAMIDELRRWDPDVKVGYVGTRRGLEARILPGRQDVRFFPIHVRGHSRGRFLSAVRTLMRLAIAMIETIGVLIWFRPQVVVGVGGYSSFPPVLLASLLAGFCRSER